MLNVEIQAQVLNVPVADRKLFAMFAAALVEAAQKPDARAQVAEVFKLFLSNVQSFQTIHLIADSRAVDLATTILAWLSDSVRAAVTGYLNSHTGETELLLANIREFQGALQVEISRQVDAGKPDALKYLKGGQAA